MALVLLAYGITDSIGGSGFLAVYVAGIVMRRADFIHKRSLIRFHDAVGVADADRDVPDAGPPGVPLAPGSRGGGGHRHRALPDAGGPPARRGAPARGVPLGAREQALVGWVGLRGAAPIILATFPLVAGVPAAEQFFHLVFFIVLISTLVQGTSIPFVARRLGLCPT